MRFLYPSLLMWGLLALVPLVLYFFRHRPRRQRVSTLLFFKSLAKEHQESAWLRRLKRLLSLLLTLLVIAGATGALARLVVSPPAQAVKSVVVVIDRSASMAATDDAGQTRLDEALERARRRLAGLPGGVSVSVMTYDSRPAVLLPRSLDQREIRRSLEDIAVRPIAGEPAKALRMARQLAALETPAVIWHFTDSPPAARRSVQEEPSSQPDPAADANSEPPGDAGDAPAELAAAEEGQADDVPDVRLEHFSVALAEPINAGITAFELRRVPLERDKFVAFVQVHGSASSAKAAGLNAELQVKLDGTLIALRKFSLTPSSDADAILDGIDALPSGTGEGEADAAGTVENMEAQRQTFSGRERLLIPVEAGEGEVMTLQVVAEGDVLATDDKVHVRIPPLDPVRVLWVSPQADPFTELALASLGDEGHVRIFHGQPDVWPPEEEIDVVIFQDWMPPTWPEDVPVIVINPRPGAGVAPDETKAEGEPAAAGDPVRGAAADSRPIVVGPVQAVSLNAGLPIESVRATNPNHPVLFGVASGRVSLTQTAVLSAQGSMEPLWTGASGPLLVAGETGGQRLVVLGFSPLMSERLPLMASYPLLLGNAIYWTTETDEKFLGNNRRTGELVDLQAETLLWSTPPAQPTAQPAAPQRQPITAGMVELDRVGLWRTNTEPPQTGSASLLAPSETVLAAGDSSDSDAEPSTVAASAWLSGDLTMALLWLLLVILVVESWLCHRHAVY